MKGVQCYELFGRVALKNDAFFLLFAVKGMFIKKSQCYWRKPQYFTSCFPLFLFHSCPRVIYDDDV